MAKTMQSTDIKNYRRCGIFEDKRMNKFIFIVFKQYKMFSKTVLEIVSATFRFCFELKKKKKKIPFMPPNWPIISSLFSKKSKERQFTFQVKESTIVGVPEPLQKPNRIKPRKITAFGLPTPLDNIQTIGFITGNAIPSLENLLMIIRRRSHTGIIDPHPI